MVIIEEEHEQAHVVARQFDLLVDAVPELPRPRVTRRYTAVHLDQPELLDRLQLAILEHLEVGRRQIGDRLAVVIGDHDIDANEIDVSTEYGLLGSVALGRVRRRLRRPGRLRVRALGLARLLRGLRAAGTHLEQADSKRQKESDGRASH